MANYTPSPLEVILTDPRFFGLQSATRAQRAICRIADGWPLPDDLLRDDTVQAILGKGRHSKDLVVPPTGVPPSQLLLVAAIRTFKSLLAAAIAVRAALFSDLSVIGKGEAHAMVFIVSNDRRNARAVYDHLLGKLQASPYLRSRIANLTASSILLRRDDSKQVEIEIRAAKKGGAGVVARWLCAAIFDECTLMLGEDEGAASLDASLAQCVGRIVPGGQIVMIGSSYAPPRGPAYELLMGSWGRPTRDLVSLWATGPELNPVAYSKRNCQALLRSGRDKARAYLTRSFRDPETGFLTSDEVDRAMRRTHDLPPEEGHYYVAASDPAAVKNVWTLVVLDCVSGAPLRYRVVLARQWSAHGGERLHPSRVIREIAGIVRPYGVDTVHSDQHMEAALSDMADAEGLSWIGEQLHGQAKADAYIELGRVFSDRLIEIPPDPFVRRDLLGVKKRIQQDNSPIFILSKDADGRHCDYVPSLLRALRHAPEPSLVGATEQRRTEEDDLWDAMIERDREADDLLGTMERLVS